MLYAKVVEAGKDLPEMELLVPDHQNHPPVFFTSEAYSFRILINVQFKVLAYAWRKFLVLLPPLVKKKNFFLRRSAEKSHSFMMIDWHDHIPGVISNFTVNNRLKLLRLLW